MKQIKYSYCVDEHNNLVHINSLTDSTRHDRKFFCLQCGQEMVANLGTKKVWYFSHKAGTTCDGESYLHKLAKRRIREFFLAAEHFPIIFTMDVPCMERKTCPCFVDSYCLKHDFKNEFDLKNGKGKLYLIIARKRSKRVIFGQISSWVARQSQTGILYLLKSIRLTNLRNRR